MKPVKTIKNKSVKKMYYKLTNKKVTEYETIDGASVSEVTYKLVNKSISNLFITFPNINNIWCVIPINRVWVLRDLI